MAIPQQWWSRILRFCTWESATVGLTVHFLPFCVYYPSLFMSFGCSIIVCPIKWANCCYYQCKLTFTYLGSLATWCSTVTVCGPSLGLDILSACFAFIWCNCKAHCLNISCFHSIFSYLIALDLISEKLWMSSRQPLLSVFTSCKSVALPPCHISPKNNLHSKCLQSVPGQWKAERN